jgi:hypothetical protein
MTGKMNDDHIGAFSLCVFGASLILFISASFANKGRESNYLVPLFAMPLMVQLTGLINLYFRRGRIGNRPTSVFYIIYLVTMILCVSFYCILWVAYNWNWNVSYWITIVAILLLLIPVLIVNFAIMMPIKEAHSNDSRLRRAILNCLKDLRDGVLMLPFWALLHFLTVFLSVSYLFGFAFAFHDRAPQVQPIVAQTPAPVSQALASSPTSSPTPVPTPQYPPLYRAKLPIYKMKEETYKDLTAGEDLCYNLYFFDSETNLQRVDLNVDEQIQQGIILKGSAQEDRARRQKLNYDALDKMIKLLHRLSARVQIIQLSLIGHADDKLPAKDSKYPSNYFLSDARAKSVQDEIIQEFYSQSNHLFTCQLLWSARGISNEPLPYTTDHKEEICNIDIVDDKMVRVKIKPLIGNASFQISPTSEQPFKRLSLFESICFALTPGGSSEVILTTEEAKFLASLVAICQMFFLVGFFNALLSLKDDPNKELKKDISEIKEKLRELKE